MIVESLLVAAMTALHFAVMPRSFRPNLFVKDMVFGTEGIKDVNTFRVLSVAKFGSVIRLNDLRRIAKLVDGPFHKVHR